MGVETLTKPKDVRAEAAAETVEERSERGRAARRAVPRSSHAVWQPPADRRDPISLLEAQSAGRVPELVPIRYGRMTVSPFTFYRGTAAIMAADLASTPVSGLTAQLCGDAHLSNFGGFAAPDRTMVFDINDFDETLPGPWEWDVKRLAASFEIAGRHRGLDAKERSRSVVAVGQRYREAMREFAQMGNLDVWYARLDQQTLLDSIQQALGAGAVKRTQKNIAKAQTKDSVRALSKLTHVENGRLQFMSRPPLLVPVDELLPDNETRDVETEIREVLAQYETTLTPDLQVLLRSFRYVDLARKVVGVGSVGTLAWVALLTGRDEQDPLVLQIKEAQSSVLEQYVGRSGVGNRGQRVVEGQRLMQATGDIMLGWMHVERGIDGRARDFYIRQLWDSKASPDIDALLPRALPEYASLCAWTLARAHARSGDRIAIAAYLGGSDSFDRALAKFSSAYADQNERDYQAFMAAVQSGRLPVQTGV
jgi:uncharacterized protein (DUF2252 family)